ncbi:MAG: hypothetical protein J6B51_03095 [Clostridia bacterium]|nr:hypothetical protein [Clostridia bacterium]
MLSAVEIKMRLVALGKKQKDLCSALSSEYGNINESLLSRAINRPREPRECLINTMIGEVLRSWEEATND